MKSLKSLPLICVLLLPTTLMARWYEVEIILFKHLGDAGLQAESWEQMPPLANLDNSRNIIAPAKHLKPIESLCFDGQMMTVKSLPVETMPINDIAPVNNTVDTTSENTPEKLERPFMLLPNDEHELNNIEDQIRRRRGYRLLFHEAWRQPMAGPKETLPLRIYAGKNFGEKFNYEGDEIVELARSQDNESMPADFVISQDGFRSINQIEPEGIEDKQIIAPLTELDSVVELNPREQAEKQLVKCKEVTEEIKRNQRPDVWQLDGTIHLYAERFRHLDTDLAIRIEGEEEVDLRALSTNLAADQLIHQFELSESQPEQWALSEQFLTTETEPQTIVRKVLKHYSMQQSRRIIDDKIHYIDHPLFGLIIQMRSYDPEADEETL